MIQPLQFLFFHPFHTTDPSVLPALIASDSESDHIIFQFIDLFITKSCKIRPQETEYTFIREILLCHIQKTSQVFYKWIQQNTSLMIHKYRNSICFKCLFQIVSIYIHITDYDTNLTITVSFFSYQFPDLFCYSHCFFSRISRHMNSKIFHFFFICSCSISENIPLQKCQLFIFLKTLYRISIQADRFLYRNVFFPRQTD